MTSKEVSAFCVDLIYLCQQYKTGLVFEKLEIAVNCNNGQDIYLQDITQPYIIMQLNCMKESLIIVNPKNN